MASRFQKLRTYIPLPLLIFTATGGLITPIFSCKPWLPQTDAKTRAIGPETFGSRQQIPKLTLDQCIAGLRQDPKSWMKTWQVTQHEIGLSRFLYCKDLLVSQFPDDNLSRECIDERLTIPFL